MPDLRKNLQVNQPYIEGNDVNDNNGWPTPLSDPSSPLKMAVTSGGNGSQKNVDLISTSQQDSNEHHLTEGKNNGGSTLNTQGDHSDKEKTSQMNPPNHSQPGGE